MVTTLQPYLSFENTARAAMEFYQSVLGGTLNVMTFGDAGQASSAEEGARVMHSDLTTDSGLVLMASDSFGGREFSGHTGFSISLVGEDGDELRTYWDRLSEGAQILLPLEKQFWGATFGQLVDRFGVSWMVNINAE